VISAISLTPHAGPLQETSSHKTICEHLYELVECIKRFIAKYIIRPLSKCCADEKPIKSWKWKLFSDLSIDSSFLNSEQFRALQQIEPKLIGSNQTEYVKWLRIKFLGGTCYGQAMALLKYARSLTKWGEAPDHLTTPLRHDALFFQIIQSTRIRLDVLLLLHKHLQKSDKTLKNLLNRDGSIDHQKLLQELQLIFPKHSTKSLQNRIQVIGNEDLAMTASDIQHKLTLVNTAVKNSLESFQHSGVKSSHYMPHRFSTEIAAPAKNQQQVCDFLAGERGHYTLSMHRTAKSGHGVFMKLSSEESVVFDPYTSTWHIYSNPDVCVEQTLKTLEYSMPAESNSWDIGQLEHSLA
jgi:hypothetical protein